MRQERIIQTSIFDMFAEHEIGRELKAMSQWLDGQPGILASVISDVRRHGVKETGRNGLTAEAVLRCALLKQHRQLSYEELAFHLEDSASFRAFARLPFSLRPKKSVLHKTISAIRPETWEAINRSLLADARHEKIETGAVMRVDSTVCEALMHAPSDSSLLWDSVRVMVRLLKEAAGLPGGSAVSWRSHRRLAKKRAHAIQHSRGKEQKVRLYRDLIAATQATMASVRLVEQHLELSIEADAYADGGAVRFFIDDAPVGASFRAGANGGAGGLSPVDLRFVRIGNNRKSYETIWYDDVRISVPEPASATLLVLAGFAVVSGVRRRRSG